VSHIEDELLAAVALGDADDLSLSEREHLQDCPSCRASLAELEAITAVGRTGRESLWEPPPQVLDRITAEATEAPATTSRPGAGPRSGDADGRPGFRPVVAVPPAPSGPREPAASPEPEPLVGRSTRPRRLALVAAVVGLIVGVGGTVLSQQVTRPETQVLASTTLTSLPGHTGSGHADLIVEDGIEKLRVTVDTASPGQDFRELWLINTDGKRMVSLGVLTASGRGSYPLPSLLSSGLQDYTIVDVSLEPFDGNSEHSRVSVVRGQLPS
jgi:anti-sigma-K factor RskA